MPLNETCELFRRHQPVDEVANIQVVVKRDVLLERTIDITGVLSNHRQHSPRAFGQTSIRIVPQERSETLARVVEVMQPMFSNSERPQCLGAFIAAQSTLKGTMSKPHRRSVVIQLFAGLRGPQGKRAADCKVGITR